MKIENFVKIDYCKNNDSEIEFSHFWAFIFYGIDYLHVNNIKIDELIIAISNIYKKCQPEIAKTCFALYEILDIYVKIGKNDPTKDQLLGYYKSLIKINDSILLGKYSIGKVQEVLLGCIISIAVRLDFFSTKKREISIISYIYNINETFGYDHIDIDDSLSSSIKLLSYDSQSSRIRNYPSLMAIEYVKKYNGSVIKLFNKDAKLIDVLSNIEKILDCIFFDCQRDIQNCKKILPHSRILPLPIIRYLELSEDENLDFSYPKFSDELKEKIGHGISNLYKKKLDKKLRNNLLFCDVNIIFFLQYPEVVLRAFFPAKPYNFKDFRIFDLSESLTYIKKNNPNIYRYLFYLNSEIKEFLINQLIKKLI